MVVRDVLLLQKRELERKLSEPYIEREAAFKELESDLIKVIMGPRRAGKSFYAVHGLRKEKAFGYVNYDDERLVKAKDYDEITNAADSVYGGPKYLLFDEIQNLPDWELYVNRLQRQGYNIVLTGSNSRLLSRELGTHLTGRHTSIILFPLSYREYVKSFGTEQTQSELKQKLADYMTYGGYPEPLVKKLDYKDYLATLFDSIVYKDVVKKYRIRLPQAIENLSNYLISNTAREHTYGSLSRATGAGSPKTIEKYLGYLEEAYVFFKLQRFSYKVKEQINSGKKIYCIDNGFIYAKAFKTGSDNGRLYENLVAIELKKKEEAGTARIYYWKNAQGEEVDYLIREGTKTNELIQVCYDTENEKTKNRETRSLLKAGKELKCKKLLIITRDYEATEDIEWFGDKGKIRYVPLWKWLMEEI